MAGWDVRMRGWDVRILMAAARESAREGESSRGMAVAKDGCRKRGSSAPTGPATSSLDDPQGPSTAKASSAPAWLLTSDKDSPDSRHVEPPEMGDVLALACEHVRYESTVGARRRLP